MNLNLNSELFFFQKIAAAWSRSNLPPKQLDAVFRSVEGVYKANRALLNVRLVFLGPLF
jgi:hypothetical protein